MRSLPEPNSRMQARPPGVSTRSISAKASERGVMLRMPKAMVTQSTEASGRGSFLASAATGMMARALLPLSLCRPRWSMGGQKSMAGTCTCGKRRRMASETSRVPAARSSTRLVLPTRTFLASTWRQ